MCLNGYFCLLFVDNSQKFLYEADLFGHVCWRCLMRKCDMRTTKQVKFSVCPHRCVCWVCYFHLICFGLAWRAIVLCHVAHTTMILYAWYVCVQHTLAFCGPSGAVCRARVPYIASTPLLSIVCMSVCRMCIECVLYSPVRAMTFRKQWLDGESVAVFGVTIWVDRMVLDDFFSNENVEKKRKNLITPNSE